MPAVTLHRRIVGGSLYILRGRIPVAATWNEWAKWFQTANRIVAETSYHDTLVSTVFVGIDTFGLRLVFETNVFGGPRDLKERKYLSATWEEAEIGHTLVLSRVLRYYEEHPDGV